MNLTKEEQDMLEDSHGEGIQKAMDILTALGEIYGARDMIVKREKGSSLDASAEDDRTTSKVGIDATIPWGKPKEKFLKGKIGE